MYDDSQLMADVMALVQANIGTVVMIALFLAGVNFIFNMFYFVLEYFSRKPFKG
jgi:hypothetical protein